MALPQIGLKDTYRLIGAGLNTLGTGLENIDNIYEETGAINNPMLGQFISGDSWQEVFNHNDLNEGIQNVRNQRFDYSNMLNNQNIYDLSNPNEYQHNIQYKQTGPWGAMLQDAGTLGSMFGPVGLAAGAVSGFLRSAISDYQKKKNAKILNQTIDRTNLWQINNRDNTIASNNQRNIRNNMRNYINNPIGSSFQDGGDLGNGVTTFNTGSTHQQNPYGGIPQGIASDGFPNMVEEGEVKYKDYIFSARLKPTKAELKDNVLPEKYTGLTFAKIAEKIQKESEDRPNDPVSIRTLDEMMGRLTSSQEEHKAKIEERRLAKALDNMSDEEKAALMASLMQQQSIPQNNLAALQGMQPQMSEQIPQEEPIQGMNLSQPMYASGGKIFIKPSKRGTFTAAAKKRGMRVQEFASKVLAHPENYTEAMRKKAQFARNSAHWGQDGLYLNLPDEFANAPWRMPYTPVAYSPIVGRHIFSSPYQTGDEYYIDQSQLFDNTQYGEYDAFGNLFTKADDGTYTRNSLMDDYFDKMSDDEYNKIMTLYNNYVKDNNLKWAHAPKNRADASRWLRDSKTDKSKIQDWHAFVNALYKRPAGTIVTESTNTTPTVPQNSERTKRYWKRIWTGNDYEDIPITQADYDNPIEGFRQAPDLYEYGYSDRDPNNVGNFDDYYITNIDNTVPLKSDETSQTSDDLLRYAPLLGGLSSLFNRPDYSYPNELSSWLGELQPISAPSLGGYRRYNPYDINLANNEAMAQLAAAQRANVAAGNREAQAAGLTALEDAYAKENAVRNLQWQQANEANRLATDQYNLGIDQTNLGVIQNYDELNQDTRNRRVALGQDIAAARDASNTAYAAAQSANLTNLLENLGEIGKENWSRNERNRLLSVWPNIARMYGLT